MTIKIVLGRIIGFNFQSKFIELLQKLQKLRFFDFFHIKKLKISELLKKD